MNVLYVCGGGFTTSLRMTVVLSSSSSSSSSSRCRLSSTHVHGGAHFAELPPLLLLLLRPPAATQRAGFSAHCLLACLLACISSWLLCCSDIIHHHTILRTITFNVLLLPLSADWGWWSIRRLLPPPPNFEVVSSWIFYQLESLLPTRSSPKHTLVLTTTIILQSSPIITFLFVVVGCLLFDYLSLPTFALCLHCTFLLYLHQSYPNVEFIRSLRSSRHSFGKCIPF